MHEIASDRAIGRLHQLNPMSLKATCRWASHGGKCGCWVTLKAPEDTDDGVARLRVELQEWLACGARANRAEHAEQAKTLKLAHGMRVR